MQFILSKDSVSYHCDKCSKQKSELSELRKLILDLKSEIELLKKASENQCTNLTTPAEEIITEVAERQLRSRNVIMYNLNENHSNDQDLIDVQDVIKKISTVPTEHIKLFRLGQSKSPNKPRPIKIIFKNSDDAISVLRNNKKLKEINSTIFVRSDLTKMQLEHLSNLRTELQERISNGEKDITIRYIRGVPKIIKSKN
ncbi:hypothetical protein RI129_009248 [Pyrocoelia pectoralis]|uniref:Uncharacterized protein n=1 Tax=Pyrocoelia pectoralis TaxID=417401 RepID=A0AAN7ZHN8_9COLE